MSEAIIGVDWGTHSSKWNWMVGAEDDFQRGEFKILRSDVRVDNNIILLTVDPPPADSIFESGIKGKLIRDPHGPFWEGLRRPIKLTLGELVSFSLWFLLSEAYQNLLDKSPAEPEAIEIRFSLPNWVGVSEAASARSKYEQAARCACHIFVQDRTAWSGNPSPAREDWQARVSRALSHLDISDDKEFERTDFKTAIERPFKVDASTSFRFVAESSAAGLTGLREFEVGATRRLLRKILVVDVGAGSTDVGYVLRTVPAVGGQNEVLVQLPPANTCTVAGESLSKCIVEIYRNRGERIGFDDAEIRKTIGEGQEWVNHSSVAEWRHGIASHVQHYVSDIADERLLPYEPVMHVLITGGSGVVSGLKEEVLAAAKRGLEQRDIDFKVIDGTALMTLDTGGRYANDVNRLAVALGAASEELPRLSYHEHLDPPAGDVRVRAKRGWTGS